MSRREDKVKSASASLQAKSLDLTSMAPARSATRVKSTRRVATDEAAYALGFASAPIIVDGVSLDGDPLVVALLRLKYAVQMNTANFERALELVLHRHAGLSKPVSETMRATAAGALLEWMNDRCEKCRPSRGQALQPGACPECRPTTPEGKDNRARREGVEFTKADGERMERIVAKLSPAPGCPKCHGLGRIFAERPLPRGMVCISCRNSGVVAWRAKRRWRMVSELLLEVQRDRGLPCVGIPWPRFSDHWHKRYYGFLGILRAADRRMGATIDFGLVHSDNREIASGSEEKQESENLIERDGEHPSHEPAAAHGQVVPDEF